MKSQTFTDGLSITFEQKGSGRPILLLHGGAGPRSMSTFADALATRAQVLTPTHPGFGGTPRPDWFDSVGDLALAYAELLEKLDLRDVLVVGQSLGGWIAAELALRGSSRIRGVVLLNAVGVLVEGHPIADAFALAPAELAALSFCEPARFIVDPEALSADARAVMAANREALRVYGGSPYMHDPRLLRRLRRVSVPALVIWGERDGIVDLEYGRAYADAFPRARFEPVANAAHFPQLEQTEQVVKLLCAHAGIG